MVKLELYIREITRFLRTVTLKNKYFADQMLQNWVKPEYQNSISFWDHPYYCHLNGKYILSNNGFEDTRARLELSTRSRCKEIAYVLSNRSNYSESIKQKAIDELNKYKDMFNSPNLDADVLDRVIVRYMSEKYGLTKTITINGQVVPTDKVYSKFDTVPIIYSFDTRKKVPFTSKLINSSEHRKTRATYRIPSTYYDKLIQEYPDEKDIIKNVLYPINCSLSDAYAAENYTILGCDLSQLEENERTSLYIAMQDKLNVIKRRWDVDAFVYEELYALSMQAKIWSILLAELFKQRLMNIRTSEVHSYHLWNYLESKGIGDYSDVLTKKQALFLYKNYPWIHRHRGSDHNLVLLTQKLLNEHHLTTHDKVSLQQTDTLRGD